MRIPRLYCSELAEGEVEIPSQEAHHAGDVLRLKVGDRVVLFDGNGRDGTAVISQVSRGRMVAEVGTIEVREFELPIRLTLAVAMPRAQRQGFLVEKCTELGVAEIWPIVSERTVVKPGRGAVEKLSRRAIEAAKQAQRSFVPKLRQVMDMAEVLVRGKEFDRAVVCHAAAQCAGLERVLEPIRERGKMLACVGPEGGWTVEEMGKFARFGFEAVRLGPAILRIETAAIAVCALVACGVDGSANSFAGNGIKLL